MNAATPRTGPGVLVSCQIPWDRSGRLLPDVLRQEVDLFADRGFGDLYVFGTAGEGYAVDTETFREVVDCFLGLTDRRNLAAMIGVIALSTSTAIERIDCAYAAGCRRFQVSLPPWVALRSAEVLTFFTDVCGAFPDAQFLHYNVAHAKVLLSGSDYRRLADEVPNLVATKNVSGGAARATDLMSRAPDLQHYFGEDNYLHGSRFGQCSLLSTFGALAPELTHQYLAAARAGDASRLLAIHHSFELIRARFVSLVPPGLADGAYDKAILRLGGLEVMPLRMLSPYEGLSEQQFATIAREWGPDDWH